MKYLKEFETTADYATYSADTENFILPNISVCNDDIYKVYYNTLEKPVLIAKYNVESDSEPTKLYFYSDGTMPPIEVRGVNIFAKAVIDGTEVSIESLDAAQGIYQLSSGEHTVEYSLIDGTTLEGPIFAGCNNITEVIIPNGITSIEKKCFTVPGTTICAGPFISCVVENVIIPNSVTSIGGNAFQDCRNLTSIDIPDSVTSIGESAFNGCSGLTRVTVNATTPPTLNSGAFGSTNDCPIYVPSASVEAYKSASEWSSYASRIQAIQ